MIGVMNALTEWLAQLGLTQYEQVLAEHEIDLEALALLSDADMAMLGIPLGPRRKILDAIASLRKSASIGWSTEHTGARAVPDWFDHGSEHRQLSVMFVDLVGWSELSERVDPDRLPQLLRSYHDVCTEIIKRHEGHVAQYLGDGVMVYFGYPRAHENNAERAVRTGLDIVSAVADMSRELARQGLPALQVRVGIHTALTVVGEVGERNRHEQLAVGSTPNVASRLQSIAEPGAVVIGASTRSLIARSFRCVDLGIRQLKGSSQPLRVYRVLAPRAWDTRFEATRAEHLTPLVGREGEIGMLLDCWQLVREGTGQIVCVRGEAGIGKSRLVEVLRERLRDEAPTEVILQCLPHFSNSPLHPIIEHSRRALRMSSDDTAEMQLDKIEALLLHAFGRPIDDVKLLASLLGVPYEERHGALGLPPLRVRAESMRMLVDVLLATARQQPVLLVLEDAHWADPSTLEVITELIRRVPQFAVLLIITHRTQFTATAFMQSGALQMDVGRLSVSQAKAFITRLNDKGTLTSDMVDKIVARGDGIPLFLEEITKSTLESMDEHGRPGAAPNPVPSTLRDSLMARLDRVPNGKIVAQIGAVLGREFSQTLVAAIARELQVDAGHALRGLAEAGLVHGRTARDDIMFRFKHALVQDVAADSLVKNARRALHASAARLLESGAGNESEAPPELLAHHYTEAGEWILAVPRWIQAGKRAAERLAHIEALHHFDQAMCLLSHYPESAQRVRIELELLVARGAVMVTLRGYAAPEVEQIYQRARQLCADVGDPVLECSVLRGQTQLLLLRARYGEARATADEMMRAAERTGGLAQLVDAYMMAGLIAIYEGRFASAAELLEYAMQRLDPGGHRQYGTSNGVDLGIGCLAYHARVLWFMGQADSALRSAREALTLASRPAVWLGAVQAHGMRALLHQAQGDVEDARVFAERTARHASEQCIPYWQALAGIVLGWVEARTGRAQAALERLGEAWRQYQSTGATLGKSWVMTVFAEAQRNAGDPHAALASLKTALEHVDANGELYFAPEIWRMIGELREPDSPDEAERCYLEAQRIARETGALTWDLRASLQLTRLWQAQGKPAQAQRMLMARFESFTEGLETQDLQEAARLLATLQAVLASKGSQTATRALPPHG